MTKFVPKHCLPVNWVSQMCRWAVGGDEAAKTNPKITWVAGHAESTNGKILLFRKNFHDGRPRQLETVFGTNICFFPREQGQCLLAINRRLARAHPNDKVAVCNRGETLHGVVQRGQIEKS